MSKYLLDTNILITAYRIKYPMDIFPSFWQHLVKLKNNNIIKLIEEVKNEIDRGEDELSIWMNNNFVKADFLKSNTQSVIKSYSQIITYVVNSSKYTKAAEAEFADVADSWLIAHALANGYTIVTEEIYDDKSTKRIKIPNICNHFKIPCINTIDFLRIFNISI